MKKFFGQEWVAWTFLGICIIIALSVGASKKPKTVFDKADALSDKTIKLIDEYNDTWEDKYDTRIATVIIDADAKKLSQQADKYIDKLDLEENDGVIVIAPGNGFYYEGGQNFSVMMEGISENTDKYLSRLIVSDANSALNSVDNVLREYYGFLDTEFRSGYTPEAAAAGSSAFSEGLSELLETIGEIPSTATGIVGNVLGWGFKTMSKIISWFLGLGTVGMIIVIVIIVKLVKNRKG